MYNGAHNRTEPSSSAPFNRNQSVNAIEPDLESTATNRSNAMHGSSQRIKTHKAPANLFPSSNKQHTQAAMPYKYELEFQELQLILLWFPEEVAMRLTEVEYELFKQVPPIEYLRHATLDMNNFKSFLANNSLMRPGRKVNDLVEEATSHDEENQIVYGKSVQDLIVRYKEVSSWIKKLIQSQPTADKRLSIILSAIRCAITCWNLGNFNSSREIWLGLK